MRLIDLVKRQRACKEQFTTFLLGKKSPESLVYILPDDILFTIHIHLKNILSKDQSLEEWYDEWDWQFLSRNANITFQDVIENMDLPWNWYSLSTNPNLTFQNVLDHPLEDWDWCKLSENPNITFQNILEHQELPWDFGSVVYNPNVSIQNILDHPELEWQYEDDMYIALSHNKDLDIRYVLENKEKDWDWEILCQINRTLDMTVILNNPLIPWKFRELSKNPRILIRDVFENPQFDWNYMALSENPNLTFQDVMSRPDETWSWYDIAMHRNVKPQELIDFSRIAKWSEHSSAYVGLLNNKNMTFDIIRKNRDIPWNTSFVVYKSFVTLTDLKDEMFSCCTTYGNPNITLKFLLENDSDKVDMYQISLDSSVTIEDIYMHPELDWVLGCVSDNCFGHPFYSSTNEKDIYLREMAEDFM